MTPRQARLLLQNLDAVDGHREVQALLTEIVRALFGGKKKEAPRTREAAMTERFGGIVLPAPSDEVVIPREA